MRGRRPKAPKGDHDGPGHFEGRHDDRIRSTRQRAGRHPRVAADRSTDPRTPGLADLLASRLHGLQLRPSRPGTERRHAAVRDRARGRGHRRGRRSGRRIRQPVRVFIGGGACADRGASDFPTDHEAGPLGATVHPRRECPAAGRPGRAYNTMLAEGRRGDAVEYFMEKVVGMPAEFVAAARTPALVGRQRGTGPHAAVRRRDHGRLLAPDRNAPPRSRSRRSSSTAERASASWARPPRPWRRCCPNGKRVTLPGQEHNIDPNVLAPALKEFFAS